MEGLDPAKVVVGGVALLACHLHACGSSLASMKEKILLSKRLSAETAKQDNQGSQVEEARVDDAFLQLRQKFTRLSMECTVHGMFMTLLWLLYEFIVSLETAQAMRLAAAVCPYTISLLVARRKIELTLTNLRILHSVASSTFIIFVLAGSGPGATDPVATQAFKISCRFLASVVVLDTALIVPMQALVSLAECWTYQSADPTSFVLAQVLVLVITAVLALSLELGVRAQLRASLASADAGSMVQGFRRVLRGICDGDVLLDSQLHVCGDGRCLEHLLMTGTSLQGRSFWDMILEEDREEFASFLKKSRESTGESTASSAAASCLRTSLRGSCNTRVAVDIFHVPLADAFGEMHHLIAFREDAEVKPVPEATEAPDMVALMERLADDAGPSNKPACASRFSESSAGSGSAWSAGSYGSCAFSANPALKEMTLLLDTSTPHCDVVQVHLKYAQKPSAESGPTEPAQQEEDRIASDFSSAMPSLRKLVLPVDWETVRSRATRYVRKGRCEPKSLPALRLRMLDDPRKLAVAKTAQFLPMDKARPSASLLWLRATGFTEDSSRCRLSPDLEGISECQQPPAS